MARSRVPWSIGIAAGVGVILCLLAAQAPMTLAFEAASVKANTSGSTNPRISMPADRFEAVGVPLRGLIALAYGEAGPPPQTRANDQIAGGPSWINTDLFDIVAKAGTDIPAGPGGVAQKLVMLRALLEERFQLAVHHENRDAAIYALLLARSDAKLGAQLQRSDVDCRALLVARGGTPAPPLRPGERPACRANVAADGTMIAGGLTMPDLANTLSRLMNRIVIDRTGLAGAFDLNLQFSPEGLAGLAPPGLDRSTPVNERPSIFTALQEQLGLRLDSTRGPIDVLVVDHAEQPGPD